MSDGPFRRTAGSVRRVKRNGAKETRGIARCLRLAGKAASNRWR